MMMSLRTLLVRRRFKKASHLSRGFMLRNRLKGESGTSILELGLLTPILLFLLLGVIEIGRYAELSIQVTNAARAGAQYGAQNLATAADNNGIENAALNDANIRGLTVSPPSDGYLGGYVLCGCSNTGPNGTCPATCSGNNYGIVYVQVNTSGTFKSLFSYPGIPSSITLTGTDQIRVAQ
jgi:Flp pilus assembly protein TadG